MDRNGYDFIIMMKGCKSLVAELVKKVKGSFEDRRSAASGITGLADAQRKESFLTLMRKSVSSTSTTATTKII